MEPILQVGSRSVGGQAATGEILYLEVMPQSVLEVKRRVMGG